MNPPSHLEVEVGRLRWRCNPGRFGFETTDELPCCKDIIGQDRALTAIEMGLEIESPGYNLYISGLTGTGKTTTVKRLLRSMRRGGRALTDICYVNNFSAPELPICICLSAGQGPALKSAMQDVLKTLREHVPKALESESFTAEQKAVADGIKKRRGETATKLEKEVDKKGFQILEVQYGPFTRPAIVPVINGETVNVEAATAMVAEGKLKQKELDRMREEQEALTVRLEEVMKAGRKLDRELIAEIAELTKKFAGPIIDTCIREVRDTFKDDKVFAYLDDLSEYVVTNLDIFDERRDGDEKKESFMEFEVNVVVDNSRATEPPVIVETSPTYGNLFGTIERRSDGRGEYTSDFTMIRSGSMVRANNGYLVISLSDILEEPAAWPALKRALKNRNVTIQGIDSLFFMPTSALKPEAIDIDVKVVIIGDSESYQVLYHYDEDFKKIFKIKADFDSEMVNDQENLNKYALFIKSLLDDEGLPALDKSAVAAVAEEAAGIAGRQDKLTTRFSDVADIVRESCYWAKKDKRKRVEASDVEKAVKERIRRSNLPEEKMSEMLVDGTILLDIDGKKVGQVNGLSVFDMGDYSFGKPVRITVETSMGRAGVINIEREAELSGKTYNKGSLILEGFLRRRFAQDKPLAMSASICFEQSYGGIDGDSASSTEIYGILSSLSGIPIRQDLAVTGSVNQKGEVQPIGGVNEKIHGFFDLCKAKGLTGSQGVMIPKLNQVDLMLRKDVVETIKDGKFHIYAVETIDEGIELLTGVSAGKENADGSFDKKSVNGAANEKLTRFAEQMKDYPESDDDKE